MDLENIRQIAFVVIGALVIWFVLALVLKLARRVISCGCSVIVALALIYALLRWSGVM